MDEQQYISDKQLAGRFDVGRATIWRWVKEENFPPPIKLSQGCTRWRIADVLVWEKTRNAAA